MLGDKILIARRNSNLNQADVYTAAGINKQTYLDIEKGRVLINKPYADMILDVIRRVAAEKEKQKESEDK